MEAQGDGPVSGVQMKSTSFLEVRHLVQAVKPNVCQREAQAFIFYYYYFLVCLPKEKESMCL